MKTPLVLLPGLLSDERLWQHQSDHLHDIASIQIIPSTADTPQKMIDNILEKAPPTFALAGHSMGGWLALELMRAIPERVTQLCLLNTTAAMDSEEKLEKRKSMIQKAKDRFFEDLVEEMLTKFVFNPFAKENVKKMFLEVGQEAFMHQEQAMLQRRETQSILSKIDCPVLIIHAKHDTIFSLQEHQELVKGIKNAKLAIVEDSGHMSPMESPEVITDLIRFWMIN